MVIFFDYRCIIVSLIIYIVGMIFLRKKGLIFLGIYSLFFIYLTQVIRLTQFPIYNEEFERELFGKIAIGNGINLIPFIDAWNITSVLNVIMFIPFGFFLPLLSKMKYQVFVCAGILFSFIIECAQLIIAIVVGYTTRVVDINDIIFNAIGTISGIIIFRVFWRLIKSIYGKNVSNLLCKYICDMGMREMNIQTDR